MDRNYSKIVERDHGVTITLRFTAPDVGQDSGHRIASGGRPRSVGWTLEVGAYGGSGSDTPHVGQMPLPLDEVRQLALAVDGLTGAKGRGALFEYVYGMEQALPGAIDRALERARAAAGRLKELRAALTGRVSEVSELGDADVPF